MKTLLFDIETDGLKPTCVHCIVTYDLDTKEVVTYRSDVEGSLNEFKRLIDNKQEKLSLAGHNIINYDIPVLEKLMGIDFSGHVIIDTLVCSRLINPSREGGHSLRNLSKQNKEQKTSHTDWSKISDEMVDYCIQDVKTNAEIYIQLFKQLTNEFSYASIELEHEVQTIITKQIQHGWLLDIPKCYDLLATLKERKTEVEEEVHSRFKPKYYFNRLVTPKIKKDGSLSNVGLKFLGDSYVNVAGAFSRIDLIDFNLGSRRQIGEYLQGFGWKPKVFTESGQPMVDEKTLKAVKDIPEASLIAEYLLIQKRIAQVNSWLEAVDEETQRVHGYVNTNGAVTGRMTHNSPNMAQVPSVGSEYGYECRSCWVVPKGYKLVGCDASGLELRMLAHYMNDYYYTNEILQGDIHTANQKAAGLSERSQAKTFIYAFLYGAGDAKIGTIVGGGAKEGKVLKDKFLKNTPALLKLRENVDKAAARGYLKGLDGRRVIVRSPHAALNTLLQSAGAIVMKKALTLLDYRATRAKLDYQFVGNIHDEFQVEVKEEHAEEFGQLAVKSIIQAGEDLQLRCPLDGEYKVGNNWAETH